MTTEDMMEMAAVKRKRLICVAVVICIAVSLIFVFALRQSAGDFGYADGTIVIGSAGMRENVTWHEDDSDIVSIESVVGDLGAAQSCLLEVVVDFSAKREVILTSAELKDSPLAVFGEPEEPAYSISRISDDGSETLLCEKGSSNVITASQVTDFLHIGAGETKRVYIPFRYFSPGNYRISYFFRELEKVQGDPELRTTCKELHTVSLFVTIPEKTEKAFDLISFAAREEPDEYFENLDPDDTNTWMHIWPVLRANFGGTLYPLDARLEIKRGLFWGEAELPGREEKAIRRLRDLTVDRGEDSEFIVMGVDCYFPDPEAEYRLILRFTENEDGSGEEYVLTLNLRFAV